VLSRTRAVLVNRNLWLILTAIAVNLMVSILTYFHTPILDERHLTGVRMATLLAFALVLVKILSEPRARALLIGTAVVLFMSFILTEKPKASWREPAAYVIENTRCDRREILVYGPNLSPWLLSYYLSDERFVLRGSPFGSDVVQELGGLNETRPGCDVVAVALNLNPKNPAEREAALAATPFRGPGFQLQEWPSAFVARRIDQKAFRDRWDAGEGAKSRGLRRSSVAPLRSKILGKWLRSELNLGVADDLGLSVCVGEGGQNRVRAVSVGVHHV
jgi:hypothetical protein